MSNIYKAIIKIATLAQRHAPTVAWHVTATRVKVWAMFKLTEREQ